MTKYNNGAGGETLSVWRDLVEAANHLSGRIRRGETKRDPEYAMAMAAKFDEITAATIEEF